MESNAAIERLRAAQQIHNAAIERLRAAQQIHNATVEAFAAPAPKIKVSFEQRDDYGAILHVEAECSPAEIAGIVDVARAAMAERRY